jgi:hypothetical protein
VGVKRIDPTLYWKALRYRGKGGATVDLQWEQVSARRFDWRFSFAPKLWVGPFRTKLHALCAAAHACRRSAKDMDWTPEEAP